MPLISDVQSLKIEMVVLVSSQKGASLLKYVARLLHQFKISNKVEPWGIFSEAYIRAYSTIDKGGSIACLYPWLSKTSLNIVRELSRKEIRITEISKRIPPDDLISMDAPIESIADDNLKKLKRGLDKLNPLDVEIVLLRYVEELSWADVAIKSCQQKGACLRANSIQKKGGRALKKLKDEFY